VYEEWSVAFKEENRERTFKNRVMRKTTGPKIEEVTRNKWSQDRGGNKKQMVPRQRR
jgi:hypothetical protein